MPTTSPIFKELTSNIANPTNLPPLVIAQIQQVAANIPPQHYDIPDDGSIVSVKGCLGLTLWLSRDRLAAGLATR